MLPKIIIIILMILMIGSLGVALYFMMTDRGQTNRTVNSLAIRVGIWVVLFAFIAIGIGTGFIKPSSSLDPTKRQDTTSQDSESGNASEQN